MNEQIQTIIDRARALLDGAPADWVVGSDGGVEVAAVGSDGQPCRRDVAMFHDPAVADLVAFAVNNIGTLCDELAASDARAKGAEHARDIFLDALGRIGAMCLGVLGEEWEGAPHDEMVGGLIDRVEEAEARAHDEANRRIETSHDLHIRLEQAEAQAAAMRAVLEQHAEVRRTEHHGELHSSHQESAGCSCRWCMTGRALAPDAGRALLDHLQAATAYIKDLEAENARLEGRTAGLCTCMAAPFAESKGATDCPECKGEGAVIVEASK